MVVGVELQLAWETSPQLRPWESQLHPQVEIIPRSKPRRGNSLVRMRDVLRVPLRCNRLGAVQSVD